MTDILIMILSTLGAIFILIASIGIFRMPDFYTRLSITIKAATLGIGCILGAAAIHFSEFSITTKVFAIVFFLFITSPVAAFLIARTAYMTGIKLWNRSVIDELKDRYGFDNPKEHEGKNIHPKTNNNKIDEDKD
ncbi:MULTISPECIES: monovalent cation/H(+) antiporter subunit G [unclassified Myroides]|uniref:monovalent cation/H(+) antiporter subunit G n=1 Tax=unclassified Myroides TaxID=2642485 RepID=UPI0015F82ED0|nr:MULTISPECIES: monovalent cation/H(+) antiporter subunit G [unclassified Myroides]MBB1149979.1 monovalent cation/H(+) antiporter subunit G [Myroides sp. NP-2]MDM1407680.1 monovalent cation/H(+) antiporter subunit G [Myroides sp. DF42-4-2]